MINCSQTLSPFKLIPKQRGVWAPHFRRHRNNLVPRRQTYSQAAGVPGTTLPTEQHSESTTTEATPSAEGLPEEANAIGDSKENRQRQKHTHHWLPSTRALTAGIFFPPKCEPTNQIRALGPIGARVAGRLLWVYKAGPAVSESFGLGTAPVRLR